MEYEIRLFDSVSGTRELIAQSNESYARIVAAALSKEWPKDAIEIWSFNGTEFMRLKVYINGRSVLSNW